MTADRSPAAAAAKPLWLVPETAVDAWLAIQPPAAVAWARAQQFAGERGRVLVLPDGEGEVAGAVAGIGAQAPDALSPWAAAALADRLPPLTYRLATPLAPAAATRFALGWRCGAYRFQRYRSQPAPEAARLVAVDGADQAWIEAAAAALNGARDLINTPAGDLGPHELAAAALELGSRHGATTHLVEGAALAAEYPLVAAVGQGSVRPPRLVDLRWGDPSHPRVTIVGKGVCFDTGGLDLKPPAGMLLMKKDMGGAACALALAGLLMALEAPVRLRLLIPSVENSVDGAAYRPGDVLRSRKGLTIEVGNTDAEGRLVLADALAEADSERPDLLIDLATLTGAARTALGPELPAVYSNDEELLAELRRHGDAEGDPLWPMPLWSGYEEDLSSRIADLNNVSASPFAGSIVGALFLRRFVTQAPAWVHLDIYAWNPRERPGRPVGAEPQGVRALYRLIRARYG